MSAKSGAAAAAPMAQWCAGFAEPWIEWDGVEGLGHDAGTVLVDGHRVPATATGCDVLIRDPAELEADYRENPSLEGLRVDAISEHLPNHDHCHGYFGDTPWTRANNCVGKAMDPPGFSFGFHLENGVMAMAMVDDHSSVVVMFRDWRAEGEIDLVTHDDHSYLRLCMDECCRDPETGEVRSTTHMGTSLEFDSYETLMAILDRVSRLEVREEQRVRPARPRPPKRKPEADRYGTITLEEWQRRQVSDG